MSWLFSQALVAEYSEVTSLAGAPSAPLSVMPTQHKFWRNDKMIEPCQLSRFGLTCAVLTEDRGADLLTWFLADSRVRTYQLPGMGLASRETDQASGSKWEESFAKLTPNTSLWKIAQRSLFEDSESSLQTWPRWGSMRNGECFHAEMSAAFTYESESGLSLPTTGANEGKGSQKRRYIGSPEYRGAKMSEGLRTCEEDPIYLNPSFAESVMMWPSEWTALKPLAMDKFRAWQQQHSIS